MLEIRRIFDEFGRIFARNAEILIKHGFNTFLVDNYFLLHYIVRNDYNVVTHTTTYYTA